MTKSDAVPSGVHFLIFFFLVLFFKSNLFYFTEIFNKIEFSKLEFGSYKTHLAPLLGEAPYNFADSQLFMDLLL